MYCSMWQFELCMQVFVAAGREVMGSGRRRGKGKKGGDGGLILSGE